MTAEQIRLVVELRTFEHPTCMQAAAEIERLRKLLDTAEQELIELRIHLANVKTAVQLGISEQIGRPT